MSARATGHARGPLAASVGRFARDRLSMAAALVFIAFVLMSISAPLVAPHDPYDADLLRRLQPPGWIEGGDWAFPLGCDSLGRDVLSRIIFGARISIAVGVAVVAAASLIGTLAGLAAGYAGGATDAVISRIVDVLLAFPYLIFAIGLMGMMGPGLQNIVLALVCKEWTVSCRVVRGETLVAREQEYVEAARAVGVPHWRLLRREILPNLFSPVLVVATTRMATIIILEASLSFLGLGVQPPTASWGSMVADGREFLPDLWWVCSFPGIAIVLLVLSITLASQGLRDAFDRKLG